MKRPLKISLLYFAFIWLCIFAVTSCKKKTSHPTNPTPGNYRLLSYTRDRTNPAGSKVSDNFRFFYNSDQTVSMILYTSNDTFTANASITFTYVNDSIFRKVTRVKTSIPVESDTFIRNSQKFITYAYTPGFINAFEYGGKLLVRRTETYYSDIEPTITVSNTYTSNNIDFLHSELGTVTANYVNLQTPLSVEWTSATVGSIVNETHNGKGLTDNIGNYAGGTLAVSATDANSDVKGGIYPGGSWFNEAFGVYPDLNNRIGDYLWLQSFTFYGANLYQNTHLVRSISKPFDSTNVFYEIDGDSKIKKTTVVNKNVLNQIDITVYNLQYETF
jgi:hypothetical protein